MQAGPPGFEFFFANLIYCNFQAMLWQNEVEPKNEDTTGCRRSFQYFIELDCPRLGFVNSLLPHWFYDTDIAHKTNKQ